MYCTVRYMYYYRMTANRQQPTQGPENPRKREIKECHALERLLLIFRLGGVLRVISLMFFSA